MSLKPDKNGNIVGFIKKEHHEKTKSNYEKTINSLKDRIDGLENSYDKLEKNHEIFKKDYKKKCEDYNKLLNKLEQKNIKKEFFSEYEILKQRNQQYFNKYGNI
tara:strand:+ start:477 stop:788 length:312 start_codon:yes stop_codon:yes gene_type:complete